MNLATFPLLCLTILVQQTICQEDPIKNLSCENEEVQKYIVDRHNELRAQVNPSPTNMLKMQWCPEAAANAQKVANQCEHCHSPAEQREITTFGCGENLYMSNRPHSWPKVLQGWWDEHKDFKYGFGATSDGAVIGHYTQFCWYRSFKVGCAVSHCPHKSLCYYYVCHYCPAGNVKKIINFPYEAGEQCSKCKHACRNGLCENPCLHNDEYEDCPDHKDLCDSSESSMDEEYRIKNICKETCNCDTEIY